MLTGDVTRGEAAAAVCLGCHSIDGSPKVGPTWKGLYGSQVELESGETVTADATYLHESIADPNAKVVKGYQPIMPNLGLDEQTIADLIAYIESLKE
jgi:cytochrome c oxidase subunit 2